MLATSSLAPTGRWRISSRETRQSGSATWKVGRRPRGITLSKDGKELFVCASDDDRIDVLDTSNGKVVRSLRSGPDPEQFILDASGNPLYVANEDDSQVTIIDIEKNKVLAEVPVGVEPEGMGLSPDGKILVNTSETTNMAHFIDTKTFQVIEEAFADGQITREEYDARLDRALRATTLRELDALLGDL